MNALFLGLAWLATAALVGIAGISILNAVSFPRLDKWAAAARPAASLPRPPVEQPSLSVLIPARDEAARLPDTLSGLLRQDFPGLEIIVLDDASQDGTAQAALDAAAGDRRLRVLCGAPLPGGWVGKNWACSQLAQAAQGELLLFTDADVRWESGSLAALVSLQQDSRADLLTVWPTQDTLSWAERLAVPLMALAVHGYLPILAVHHLPWPVFSAANGQCLLFRRPAYRAVGGHAAVRDSIVEDISLAWRIKGLGLRLRMAEGAGLIGCRMYAGWQAVLHGYAKNILAGHANQPLLLLLSTAFHLTVFFAPWLWLAFGWLNPAWPGLAGAASFQPWPAWPLALISLGVGVRALTAAASRQRPADALLLPLSVLLMTAVAMQALYWRFRYGGPRWKGRLVR
jgi:chlorobactene glucosyltransferase